MGELAGSLAPGVYEVVSSVGLAKFPLPEVDQLPEVLEFAIN